MKRTEHRALIKAAQLQVDDAQRRLSEARYDFDRALTTLLMRERIRGELGRKLEMLCEEAHLP